MTRTEMYHLLSLSSRRNSSVRFHSPGDEEDESEGWHEEADEWSCPLGEIFFPGHLPSRHARHAYFQGYVDVCRWQSGGRVRGIALICWVIGEARVCCCEIR